MFEYIWLFIIDITIIIIMIIAHWYYSQAPEVPRRRGRDLDEALDDVTPGPRLRPLCVYYYDE